MRSALADEGAFPASADVAYLDQASVGLVPERVRDVLRSTEQRLARGTIDFDDEVERRALDPLRQAAGRLLNAPASSVAVVSSATEAINQFAWWLRPGVGRNVVLIDADFPSVVLPWVRLAEDTGVELRLMPVREAPGRLTAQRLTTLIDDETAAVSVSHVQFATGHRLDLAELSRAAHQADALLIVDATQSAGVIPIDLVATPVDVLVASSHKWLCAPHGVAICCLTPELDRSFRPPFVGWRGVADPMGFASDRLELASGARRMELGSVPYGVAAALSEAINYLSEFGPARISEHDLSLAGMLHDGLSALGADVVTPREPERRAAIVSARFSNRDAVGLARALAERRVRASARLGYVRLSTHVFNDEGDVERALSALEAASGMTT